MKRWISTGLVALAIAGCHKPKRFEADVQLTRWSPVRRDETGTVLTSDLEVSFVECPGDQIEVIRGGRDFSACVAKLKIGDKVHVKLDYHWDDDGFWDHDIIEVQGCTRPVDPNDEASFKMIRECSDWNVNGTRVGFQCNYANKPDLNKKCPWFKKH
jgi:hypothetical protein